MISAGVGPNAPTVRGQKRHGLRNIPSFCFRFTPEIKRWREEWSKNKEPHRKTNRKGEGLLKSTILFQGIGTHQKRAHLNSTAKSSFVSPYFHSKIFRQDYQHCFSTLAFPTLCLRCILSGVGVVATSSGLGVSAEACDPKTKLKLRTSFSKSAKQLKCPFGATNAPAFGMKLTLFNPSL